MHRGITKGNKICAKWDEQRRHDRHRERIRNIRPVTDTSEPFALQMDHIRNNLKREQMLEDRYSEIDRENRILLKKMSDIMKTQTTPRTMENCSGPVSLNRDARKKELLRITRDNQHILKRIQQAQPIYNHIQWEAEHRKNQHYAMNCAEYPPQFISRQQMTPRSELLPLPAEDEPLEYVPSTARSGVPQELPGIEAPREDFGRCVFKDGRQIGDTYYLVEMSTDGLTLTISASNADRQISVDLVVKEKQHRRLFRETNGDYGLLAQRLRVVDGATGSLQLVLDDGEVPAAASMPASARGASSPPSARGPASSPPTARVEGGRAAKAAEGVREQTAAYIQMAKAPGGPKVHNPAATSPPTARSPPLDNGEPSQERGSQQHHPKAPPGAAPKRTGRPGGVQAAPKPASSEELDVDAMIAARSIGSAGGDDSEVRSQAATVYSAGGQNPPGTAGSNWQCEVDLSGDPQVVLRGLTPDRRGSGESQTA
jgi:E3 ubiquitin-protein ligase TRIP12